MGFNRQTSKHLLESYCQKLKGIYTNTVFSHFKQSQNCQQELPHSNTHSEQPALLSYSSQLLQICIGLFEPCKAASVCIIEIVTWSLGKLRDLMLPSLQQRETNSSFNILVLNACNYKTIRQANHVSLLPYCWSNHFREKSVNAQSWLKIFS